MTVLVFAAVLLSGQAAPPARSATDLTRDLNSAPPGAMATPAPVRPAEPEAEPEPEPEAPAPARRSTPPQAATAPSVPAPERPGASLTRDLNSAPPAAIMAPPTAAPPTVAPSTRAPTSQPAPEPAPGRAPAPAPARVPVAAPPPAAAASPAPATRPAPAADTPADPSAALPFRIDLPAGFTIEPSDAGPQAKVYAVKRDGRSFVMIYQGPASQFPIYDGQLIDAGGRASVVIEQDGRRRAVEHLFAKDLESRETHVWLSYLDGEDSLLAEQIAQSVEPR